MKEWLFQACKHKKTDFVWNKRTSRWSQTAVTVNEFISQSAEAPVNLFLLIYRHRALSLQTHQVAVRPKHHVICQIDYVSDHHTASIFVRKVNMDFGLTHCSLERGNVTEDNVLSRQPSTLAPTYQTTWCHKTAILTDAAVTTLNITVWLTLPRLTYCLCSKASKRSTTVNRLLGVESKNE